MVPPIFASLGLPIARRSSSPLGDARSKCEATALACSAWPSSARSFVMPEDDPPDPPAVCIYYKKSPNFPIQPNQVFELGLPEASFTPSPALVLPTLPPGGSTPGEHFPRRRVTTHCANFYVKTATSCLGQSHHVYSRVVWENVSQRRSIEIHPADAVLCLCTSATR